MSGEFILHIVFDNLEVFLFLTGFGLKLGYLLLYLTFVYSRFDLYDWPIGVGSKDDRKGLDDAVQQIETEVAKLGQAGIPPSKIVVGGFSQGGAIAVLTAYRRKEGEEAFAARFTENTPDRRRTLDVAALQVGDRL